MDSETYSIQRGPIADMCARLLRYVLLDEHNGMFGPIKLVAYEKNTTIVQRSCGTPCCEDLECVDMYAGEYGPQHSLLSIPATSWSVTNLACLHGQDCTSDPYFRQSISFWTICARMRPAVLSAKPEEGIEVGSIGCCLICWRPVECDHYICDGLSCVKLANWFVNAVYFLRKVDLIEDVLAVIETKLIACLIATESSIRF